MFRGLLVAFAACTTVDNAPAPDPAAKLDAKLFACSVEPILIRQCSYTACHGQAQSALRVYSPGKLRATKPGTIDDAIAPLTDDEHKANFESAAGFASLALADNFLLRKPLPGSSGGFEHVGGAIFSGPTDPQYLAIVGWLANSGACK